MKFVKGHKINVGRKLLEETRRKISESHKGVHPSEESKQKNRLAHLGKRASKETIEKIRQNNAKYWQGKAFSNTHLNNLSISHKGQIAWNKREDIRDNLSEIIHLYKEELLSCKEIGNKFDCSDTTIMKILKEIGILMAQPERMRLLHKSGKIKAWNDGLTKEVDERIKNISNQMSITRKGVPLKEEHRLKVIKNVLINGAKTRFKNGSIPWNKNIPCSEETKRKSREAQLGPKSHCWINGSSYEPYPITFNREFKNLVKLRDNFCCLNCGISEQKHMVLFNRKLPVHHIDYDKKNTCLVNCCTLCTSCNGKVNKNRAYWTKLFQEKLSQIYGYKYEDGKIVLKLEELNL